VIVHFDKHFLKDIKKLNEQSIASQLKAKIIEFENANELIELRSIKKLKGYNSYFRLKIGNHRLGFRYEDNEITVIRFLHRKDIYKLFP